MNAAQPSAHPSSPALPAPGVRIAAAVRVVHHLREALRHVLLAHEADDQRLQQDLRGDFEPALEELAHSLDCLAHERWAADPLLGNQLEEMAVETEDLLADLRRVVVRLREEERPRRHLRGHAVPPQLPRRHARRG